MSEVKKRDISGISDVIFKNVFNSIDIVVDYINIICDVHLKKENAEFVTIESKTNPYLRGARFDIRAKGEEKGVLYHIDFEAQKQISSMLYHDRRKFFYAAHMMVEGYKEGDDFESDIKVREIFFIKDSTNFSGSPIKKICYTDLKNGITYPQVEIYEIYIDELIKQNKIDKLDEYDKMILEVVEVLVSKNVENYLDSNNPLTKKVAEKIMMYTEEEIKRMQEQFDKENQAELRFLLKEEHKKGKEEGIEEGIEKGAHMGMVKIVKSLNDYGFKPDEIAKLLDKSIEEIEDLLNEK